MAHDVFISHSSQDKSAADAVCAALEANGVRCWIAPRDISPGEKWATAILHGIAESRLMVLVFSDYANNSEHIQREVERAVHRGIPIAPLRLENVMPKDDLEYFLSSSHWMDALTPPLENHLRRFTQQVRGLLETGGQAAGKPPDLSTGTARQEKPAAPSRSRSRVHTLVMLTVVLGCLGAAAWAVHAGLARRFAAMMHLSSSQGELPGDQPTQAPGTPAPSAELEALRLQPKIETFANKFTNSIGMHFVRIEPGEFVMGSPTSEQSADDETQHKVKLTRAFMMGVTTVTQKQYVAVMGSNPSNFKGDDFPVEMVTWAQAMTFCRKLSERGKNIYRLPTEAQWEYACRAGTTTAYNTGDDEAALVATGWFRGNDDATTHPVGRKKPNLWGLYDMHGNVWQWCSDIYGDYPKGDAVDPTGAATGDLRVIRGGSWSDPAKWCRSAYRRGRLPTRHFDGLGFRVCLDF